MLKKEVSPWILLKYKKDHDYIGGRGGGQCPAASFSVSLLALLQVGQGPREPVQLLWGIIPIHLSEYVCHLILIKGEASLQCQNLEPRGGVPGLSMFY